MSGPPLAPRGGPMSLPPFQPNVESLYLLSNLIQEAIHQFETSPSPKEKATALQSIQTASTKLSCLTTPLPQQFMQMNFGPNLNVAVRIALEMSLFEALRMSGSPLTCSSIASKTSSDPEFVLRVSRVLAAFEILQESQDEKGEVAYAHTMVSRFLTAPPAKAGAKRLFDNMFQAQANSASGYYKEHELHSPNDPKNTAFTFAHGEKDKGIFDILEERPERMKLFNDAMTVTVQFGLKELAGCYPWGSLGANEDGIVLVDVGGGKGHVVKELKESTEAFKGKGKLVLQDMKVVLDGGVVVDDEAELMPYDFLTEEQPIKGANYFFKAIFHDWPDPSCLQILKNLKPAMIPTSANPTPKLLIIDLVLPDHSPPPGLVLRDINMLVIGGKERSLSQWEKLLGEGGFKIIGVHGQDGMPVGSVVECVLA